MEKIVIVQLSSQYIHSSLGGWAVKAGAIKAGVTNPICILELNINQTVETLLATIVENKPDLLGFSTYIWNVDLVLKLASSVKTVLPQCRIVLGGPEITQRENELLCAHPFLDALITGAGEEAFAKICLGMEYADIAGVSYKSAMDVIQNPPMPLEKPFTPPYTKEYFDQLDGRIAYIETTRGCPFHCAFCMSGKDSRVDALPLESVYETVAQFASSGTKTLKFVDRTFNAQGSRSRAIWSFLVKEYKRFKGMRFHFEIGADLLKDEDFAVLQTVPKGYFQFEAGIQSFHEKTLEACNRKTPMETLTKNLQKIVALGTIPLHIDLIAGLPYEDLPTFLHSFDQAFAIGADNLQLGFLKLLHACELRQKAVQYGYQTATYAPYEVLVTNWLSFEDFQVLKGIETVLDLFSNHGRYDHTLQYLLETTHFLPSKLMLSLWHLLKELLRAKVSQVRLLENLLTLLPGNLPSVKRMPLRNVLLRDEFTHNPQGTLPRPLIVEDARLYALKKRFQKEHPDYPMQRVCILHGTPDRLLVALRKDKDTPPIFCEEEIGGEEL